MLFSWCVQLCSIIQILKYVPTDWHRLRVCRSALVETWPIYGISLNSVLNVKALVRAFNQKKTLAGAFSMIVQLHRFLIVCSTTNYYYWPRGHYSLLLAPSIQQQLQQNVSVVVQRVRRGQGEEEGGGRSITVIVYMVTLAQMFVFLLLQTALNYLQYPLNCYNNP